jgi:hypothetical protein
MSSAPYGVSALAGFGEQPSDPRRGVESFDIQFFSNGHLLALCAALEETLDQSEWQALASCNVASVDTAVNCFAHRVCHLCCVATSLTSLSSLSSAPYGVSALACVGEQPSDPRRKIDSFDISVFENGHILSQLAAIEKTLHESDWQARACLAFAGSDGYNCATEREFRDSLARAAPNLVTRFEDLSLHNKKQEELIESSAQTLALRHAEEQRKIESEFARTRASLGAIPQAPPLTSTAPGYSPLRPVTREGIQSPAPVQGSRVKEEGDMPSTFTLRFGVRALTAPTPLELAQRERDESLSHATVRYEHSLNELNLQLATRVRKNIDGFPTFEAKAVSLYCQLCEQALGALQSLLQPETSRQLLHAAEITLAASLDPPPRFVDVWRSIRAMVPKDDMRALRGLTKPIASSTGSVDTEGFLRGASEVTTAFRRCLNTSQAALDLAVLLNQLDWTGPQMMFLQPYLRMDYVQVTPETVKQLQQDLRAQRTVPIRSRVPIAAGAAATPGAAQTRAGGRGSGGGRGGGSAGPSNATTSQAKPAQAAAVDTCNYCKKPGHTIDKCAALAAKNGRRVQNGGAAKAAAINVVFELVEFEPNDITEEGTEPDSSSAAAALPAAIADSLVPVQPAVQAFCAQAEDFSLLDRSEYELIVDSGAGKNICLSCYLHDLTPVDAGVRWGNGAQDAVIGEGLLVVDVWSKHPFSSDERMQRLEILCWGVDSCLVPLLSTRNLADAGIKTIFSNESGLRADYLDLGDGVRLSLDARSRLSCSIVKPSDFETRYQEWVSRVSSDSSFCAAWLAAMDSDTHYAEMMTAGVAANTRQHDDESRKTCTRAASAPYRSDEADPADSAVRQGN